MSMDRLTPESLSSADLQTKIGQLKQEHSRLEARLIELNSHSWLSSEERLEIKDCKKLKLVTKDQIASLSILK